MALQRARATVNSITFKLVLVIYAILVPIIVLLIYINNQTRDTLLAQVESTRQNMLQSYMQRVDSSLQGAFTYANGLATQSNDTKVAAYAGDETAVAYAKVRIGNALQDKAGSSDLVDGYFALLQTYQGPSFLQSTHSTADAADKERIRAFVEENLAAWSARDAYWQLCSLEGTDYLLLVTSDGEGIYTGMYINLARMVQRLAGSGAEGLLYAPDAEAPAGTRLLLAPSGIAPLTLGYLLDEGEVLASLPFMQRYTPLVTLSLLMLIPAVFLLLRQIVSKPMGRLTAAMRRVQKGDLDTRLPPAANASTEMRILSDTFNHMLERIQNLKISVYEKELAGQKAREWYEAGYVSRDVAATQESGSQMQWSGKLFATLTPSIGAARGNITNGMQVRHIFIDDIPNPVVRTTADAQMSVWSIPTSCQRPDKAVQLLNLMFAHDDLGNLFRYGIEGTHYEILEDGTVDLINTAGWQNNWYLVGDYNKMMTRADAVASSGVSYEEYVALEAEWDAKLVVTSPAYGFTFDPAPVSNEIANCDAVNDEYGAAIGNGTVDPTVEVPKYIAALEAAGLQTILDEAQRQLDEWVAQQ